MPRNNRSRDARSRKKKKSNHSLSSILVFAAVILAFIAYTRINAENAVSSNHEMPASDSLMKVVMHPAIPDIPVRYTGMDLSFNPSMHIPNWVAWELTGAETRGDVKRKNKFESDPDIPGCADDYDYLYSGYDRGHMAPAGDMKWSREAMDQTFLLTNICPQAHSLNSGTWKRLEEKCRTWARADSAIIIVCGPVLTDSIRDFLGDNRVAVPKRFFKVILSPYIDKPRAIGFIMNNGYIKGGLQQTACSVDDVEHITGYDFFSALPDSVENMVESRCDFNFWFNIKDPK